MKEQESYSVDAVKKIVGCTSGRINDAIFEGRIKLFQNRVSVLDMKNILQEKETYISLYDYAVMNSSDRFNGKSQKDRNNLMDYLEQQEFFGIEFCEVEDMILGNKSDGVFFRRTDICVLDKNLREFFQLYALTSEEQIKCIISMTKGHSISKKYIEKFMNDKMLEKVIPPACVQFVKCVLDTKDVKQLNNEDVVALIEDIEGRRVREYVIQWLNYVRKYCRVSYDQIKIKQKESISISAYSSETYIELAKCIFNAEYIHENDMIKKSLDNYWYAEMWLYLSIFYACGWRAGDVCRGWRYLKLKEHGNGCLGINTDTLYDDILYDRISDEVYENVCKYALGCIELSGQLPSKNANYTNNSLLAVITEELYTFYGMLTLIGEVHMLKSDNGYMRPERRLMYQNKVNLANFFGPEIGKVLKNKNIHSRRLNKNYLQAIENEGRKEGYGGILTSALAAYARNHANYDTVRIYLQDHQHTGETAEVVLFCMAQRGVFGYELYQTLITAYPEAMSKLTLKEQSTVMEQMNIEPLALETAQSGLLAAQTVKELFISGNEESMLAMLNSMFEISQTRGKAKDTGVYCLKRSVGQICSYPEWKSCLANACPYLVFSRYGYLPLLQMLHEYQIKINEGDVKAKAVFQQILKPRFQSIVNQIIKEYHLEKDEREGMKWMLQEVLNG